MKRTMRRRTTDQQRPAYWLAVGSRYRRRKERDGGYKRVADYQAVMDYRASLQRQFVPVKPRKVRR